MSVYLNEKVQKRNLSIRYADWSIYDCCTRTRTTCLYGYTWAPVHRIAHRLCLYCCRLIYLYAVLCLPWRGQTQSLLPALWTQEPLLRTSTYEMYDDVHGARDAHQINTRCVYAYHVHNLMIMSRESGRTKGLDGNPDGRIYLIGILKHLYSCLLKPTFTRIAHLDAE